MRILVVIGAVVGLLVILAAGAEVGARALVDSRVTSAVADGLRESSADGTGFADVDGEAYGWGLPVLLGGPLDGTRATARDGDIGGVPIQSLDMSTGPFDLDTGGTSDLVVTAVIDREGVVALANQATGLDLGAAEVTRGEGDTVDIGLPIAGAAVSIELEVVDGALMGGIGSASLLGSQINSDLLASSETLVDPAELPPGLEVTDVEVRDGTEGAEIVVTLSCTSDCRLEESAA